MPDNILANIEEMMGKTLDEIKDLREHVTREIRAEQNKRKTGYILMGLAMFLVVAALYGGFRFIQSVEENTNLNTNLVARLDAQADRDAMQNCEQTNMTRTAVRTSMTILIAELAAGREHDPSIRERIERLDGTLDEALPIVKC